MGEDQFESMDFDQTDYEFAMGQRQFQRQTKEDRIYGIWADEEEDRPSFGGGKKRANDTAPMKFVSGGVKIGSKTELPDGTSQEEEEEEVKVEARPEKRSRTSFASQRTAEVGSQVFAGMRNTNFSQSSTSSAWSKSGKGNVVMQMMQKMGYEHGKGLGKSKQGIVEPVQAVQRPGRGAVGAYGSEAKGPKFGESAAEAQARINVPSGDIGEIEASQSRGQWKKSNASRKVKIHYKTLDDVISEGGTEQYIGVACTSNSIGKIIDMTGPEQRIYDDFSSFSRRARLPMAEPERTKFNIPELVHNLNTLLDVTEEEICKSDREIKRLKDQNEVLKAEDERMAEEIVESRNEITKLEDVECLIRRFYQSSKTMGGTSMEECRDLFLTLRDRYSPEYALYGLEAIAIPVLLPKIRSHFANWDPLDPEQAEYGLAMMTEWRDILGETGGGSLFRHFDRHSNSSISAYDHCVWSGWMPFVRKAALNWNPRSNGPVMISLVQMWMPVLPNWVLENFLEQVLVPRITTQVDEWEPTLDVVPIESWLLPWHSLMGDRLLLAYATLRQKLSKGLRNWIPGDRSAIESLRPWKGVFSAATLQAFVNMNVMPKLEKMLQTMDLRNTEHFEYVELFDWMELVSADVIAQILVKGFFPRYLEQLCCHLNAPGLSLVDLDRIKKQYIDWKNLFPQEIQQQQLVMGELKRVLLAIGQAQSRITGVSMPGVGIRVPAPHPLRMPPGPFGLPPPPPHFAAQLPPSSFKQLIESSAISNGIQFFPQRSKFHDGKQVYMFGDHSVYIDGTMLFYYNPPLRQWLPASLNQMLEMCKQK